MSTAETQPVVVITENAAQQIKNIQAREPDGAGKSLRIYVEGGGCSGLQYGMIFDEKRDGDLTLDAFGLSVVVDPESANFIRGAVIDYADSLAGGGFKITNPNARHSCGCGKSFEA